MANYLLLRNNKESGPFSLEQLTTMGLKAYDLIWIEGRSAGWRYPSEINELKPIAPVVEEQPYDRFYKKSSAQTEVAEEKTKVITEPAGIKIQQEPVSKVITAISNHTIQPSNSSAEISAKTENPSVQPSFTKKIFVTLPQNPANKPATKTVEEKKTVIEEKPKQVVKEEPVVLEEKYSQPLDEIKKQYINTVLNQKKNIRPQFVISEKVKLVALALLLILSGTAVGLFINRNSTISEKMVTASTPQQKVINTASTEQEPITEIPKETSPAINNNTTVSNDAEPATPIVAANKKTETTAQQEKSQEENVAVNINPTPENRKAVKRESASTNQQPATSSPNEASAKLGNQQPITTNNKPQTTNKPNLAKEINITASNYKRATFGGISNLEFTVTNTSSYTIDMVAAEVEYYTANKKLYKTETLYFSNVPPNGTQVQKAPDSNRGYEVKYRISLISSKELGLYTANL